MRKVHELISLLVGEKFQSANSICQETGGFRFYRVVSPKPRQNRAGVWLRARSPRTSTPGFAETLPMTAGREHTTSVVYADEPKSERVLRIFAATSDRASDFIIARTFRPCGDSTAPPPARSDGITPHTSKLHLENYQEPPAENIRQVSYIGRRRNPAYCA
jgi:hypothetical protein